MGKAIARIDLGEPERGKTTARVGKATARIGKARQERVSARGAPRPAAARKRAAATQPPPVHPEDSCEDTRAGTLKG